jgi:hypothetical protein
VRTSCAKGANEVCGQRGGFAWANRCLLYALRCAFVSAVLCCVDPAVLRCTVLCCAVLCQPCCAVLQERAEESQEMISRQTAKLLDDRCASVRSTQDSSHPHTSSHKPRSQRQ